MLGARLVCGFVSALCVMSGVISVVLVCLAGWWYLGMSGYSLVGEWMEVGNGMSGYPTPVTL